MTDEFEIAEQKGRALFKSFLDQIEATDQQPTTGKYNPVDYHFTFKGVKYVAEIKVRDNKYLNYPTHMIEKDKLHSLLKDKANNNCKSAYYINFFNFLGEDIMYLYHTDNIIKYGKPDVKLCPETTAKHSKMVYKDVLMIPTTVARILIRKDGKWQIDNSNK